MGYRIQMMGLNVTLLFLWIPAPIGIKWNQFDFQPSSSTSTPHTKQATKRNYIDVTVRFSKTEMKTAIKHKLKERWQKK